MNSIQIYRIRRAELKTEKWDALMLLSGEVFMQSWYLDVVWPQWEALIAGDYEAGVPLFQKKNIFGTILSQPSFTDALRIAGSENAAKKLTEHFTKIILQQSHVFASVVTSKEQSTRRFQRWNRKDVKNYPEKVLRRNLRKADAAGLQKLDSMEVNIFIQELKKNLRDKATGYQEKHFILLEKIIHASIAHQSGFVEGIKTDKGWHAGQFYIKSENRCYLVCCFSDAYSRENSGLHFLLHSIFEKAGEQGEVHFGGSNIPAIAEFNKNFGAEDEFYCIYEKSFMPGPFKKLIPF